MQSPLPNRLNLTLFLFTLFCSLMVDLGPIWSGYGDPYDYMHQSTISLLDMDFYNAPKNDQYYPRPFTVPLFYKMANGQPDQIIAMQKFMHALATFFFASVIILYLKNNFTKISFIIGWYLLMTWWNISGWDHTILSESLSLSLMFMWFGTFLLYVKKKNTYTFIFHICITILFSFTRDSWPYVLLAFYFSYFILSFKLEKDMTVKYVSLFALSLVLFFVQQHTAKTGKRYRLPVLNNIVYRILPNAEYTEWFKNEGLPCLTELKKEYSNPADYKAIYPLYLNDSTYKELHQWASDKGNMVYMKFLLTHPSQLLLLNETKEDLSRIFAYDLIYTTEEQGLSRVCSFIFPLFNPLALFILLGIYCWLCFKDHSKNWIFQAVTILICIENAFLLYNADALEVERHLFFTHVLIQFTGLLLTIFIVDSTFVSNLLNAIRQNILSLFRKNAHNS